MQKKNNQHQSRLVAFQVLYGLSFATITSEDELKTAFALSPAKEHADEASESLALDLVLGVWREREAIDQHITKLSRNWRLERIGHIELTLLRLAFFELFSAHSTPPKVIVQETRALTERFAEPQSKKFIVGILEAALRNSESATARERHTP